MAPYPGTFSNPSARAGVSRQASARRRLLSARMHGLLAIATETSDASGPDGLIAEDHPRLGLAFPYLSIAIWMTLVVFEQVDRAFDLARAEEIGLIDGPSPCHRA
jgi:hypothetical protein